jgi:hypothetical protein
VKRLRFPVLLNKSGPSCMCSPDHTVAGHNTLFESTDYIDVALASFHITLFPVPVLQNTTMVSPVRSTPSHHDHGSHSLEQCLHITLFLFMSFNLAIRSQLLGDMTLGPPVQGIS